MARTTKTAILPAEQAIERAAARLERAKVVCSTNPEASFQNVWHTLVLLEASPIERLNRSLLRGRAATVQ